MKFKHGTAIVTGGAKGNGLGMVNALAEKGVRVAIFNRHSPEEIVKQLKLEGKDVVGFTCDITDKTAVEKCVKETYEMFGSVDILVNNAGVLCYKPFLEMSDEERDQQLEVNIKGTWNITKAVVPYMLQHDYGRIVTVSSVTGEYVADPGAMGYGTSKAALVGFGKCLAMEFAEKELLPILYVLDLSEHQWWKAWLLRQILMIRNENFLFMQRVCRLEELVCREI